MPAYCISNADWWILITNIHKDIMGSYEILVQKSVRYILSGEGGVVACDIFGRGVSQMWRFVTEREGFKFGTKSVTYFWMARFIIFHILFLFWVENETDNRYTLTDPSSLIQFSSIINIKPMFLFLCQLVEAQLSNFSTHFAYYCCHSMVNKDFH